jgi:GAF domain-containing protein
MGFPIPTDEARRLRTLREHDLLDLSFNPELDDIVQLAAVICDAPISLVTLIDEDKQVFKARLGLRSTGTSRSISMCAHVIMQRELFVVNDATADLRFKDFPGVIADPHVRFYAGMPIVAPDESCVLGTLCVIDRQVRQLNASQRESLRLLARLVRAHFRGHINEMKVKRTKAA